MLTILTMLGTIAGSFILSAFWVYLVLAIWLRITNPEEFNLAKQEIKTWITTNILKR